MDQRIKEELYEPAGQFVGQHLGHRREPQPQVGGAHSGGADAVGGAARWSLLPFFRWSPSACGSCGVHCIESIDLGQVAVGVVDGGDGVVGNAGGGET
jgi:hypothetical protein